MSDEAVQEVWTQFMTGQWEHKMNATYYDNGTTELRLWNFAEQQGLPTQGAAEEMAILGTDGKKCSSKYLNKMNRQARSLSMD